MKGNRLGLTVISGLAVGSTPGREPQRIALSLVHPRERIDIPVTAIYRIESHGAITFWDQETGTIWESPHPHVEVWLSRAVRERIYRLTRHIVDESMEIVVGGECVSRPIVREPLGLQPCFQISADDLAEARALAYRLRMGWREAGPRAVC